MLEVRTADGVSSPHRYCRKHPGRGAPGRETLIGSIATSERWIKPAPEELCRGGTRISGNTPSSSTPQGFCSTGGRRSRCSRHPVQVSSRLRCGGPIGALNAAWRIGVNLSAAWSNGALNAARRPTRWKAVFDVARPAFTGSVPTSTAVSGRRSWGSTHRSQLMTIEVASPIRSECAVASIRPMHPTGRPNE